MDDLISRQAAIKQIEAIFPVDPHANEWAEGVAIGAALAKQFISTLPSAQPEIIRCKDCKWYEGDITANPWGVCCHDGWVGGHIGHEVSERGWCYRAERRTDEQTD